MKFASILFLSLHLSASKASTLSEKELIEIHKNYLSEDEFTNIHRKLRSNDSRRLQSHMGVIHDLIQNRDKIDREVGKIDEGLKTTTTSDDDDVADLIKKHVDQMNNLSYPIRQGDPLFATMFKNIDDIHMDISFLDNGVIVNHIGDTECAVDLIRDHGYKISNDFLKGVVQPDWDWEKPDSCD